MSGCSRIARGIAVLSAAGLWAVVCVQVQALERVNLRNGFSYDCARSEPLDSAHVRLFLAEDGPAAGGANFIDLAAQEIVSVERLPDPPPSAKPAAAAEGSATFEASATAGNSAAAHVSVSDLLARAGAQHNIDVELLASVVKAESGGRANAVSPAGARGLMQLMPGTAQQLGVEDAFRPEQNIAGGAAYLDALLTRYNNNLSLALAAYNAGPAAVDRYHGVPPFRETRVYVARVENEFKRRKLALEKTTPALR
jgi:soluble lytic murein transglycosylase-like protein